MTLTGDEYIALLVQRREEHYRRVGGEPKWPALLEWFIRDGDEALFTPPPNAKQPKREPRPRKYRPAQHWRDKLARIDARLAALNGLQRHPTDDPAAYGGIGVQQRVRQRRKYGDRIDRTAAEHVRLTAQREDAAAKLWRAEQREAAS